ncbi:MAG: MDR family oxidoreductase [Corynebacterium sp.]|uniref:MDR family oxidoreductase n=1 Tax=Corynebacterium sp. TaxID=1720 RepID=UPI0026E0902D|nr:MDR family oxidoreductase [Corynebacterium sp.]MDO5669737.1 MDR family oxidoreductase [Corynebacterium sp.]
MNKSLVVTRTDDGVTTELREELFLGDGDMFIDVTHSSLNYKDAMALRGDKGVMRVDPLVPGIDVVGTSEGQLYTVNGTGLGEFRHGGYTTQQRVPADAAIPVPERFDAWHAAAIGTAGFTAAMSVVALREQGVEDGEVLVTGATGGVGSIAVHLLARLGYDVVASTGRPEHSDWLRGLGAAELIGRLDEPGRPLQKARWAGVVDCVGSHTLVNACAQTVWGGTVTACGLTQGPDLPATVLPFILRGVKLVGINSVDAPRPVRERAWELLDATLDLDILTSLTTTISLDEVVSAGEKLMDGQLRGRTVVEI